MDQKVLGVFENLLTDLAGRVTCPLWEDALPVDLVQVDIHEVAGSKAEGAAPKGAPDHLGTSVGLDML